MEARRERKNIILTIPRSQWLSRKNKLVKATVKATVKKVKTALKRPGTGSGRRPYRHNP